MIIDKLTQAEKYYSLHKRFKPAFEYLHAQNLQALEVGVYDVTEGVKVIVSDRDGVTRQTAAQNFECHNKNIDIQLLIRGNETMGWRPRTDCNNPKGEYSDDKDVLFFADEPDMHFSLKSGQFVIFYPDDVHSPMIGEGLIKKLVVKVQID